MNIAVVGTGYVGLVSGTCFAEMGVNVTCVDVNEEKIKSLLDGQIPIYEPGLDEMVLRNHREGRLNFTTDLKTCLDNVDIVFSAVGTPPDEDGSADLTYVLEVARTVGRNINKYVLLVTKSTVPVGTAQKVKKAIHEELEKRGVDIEFDVASNPEFLKEGAAIQDFMRPDRVVVGIESEKAKELMSRLYRPVMLNNFRVIFTDIPSAEMIKYAANSMLATRISFMNDIANLCELVGADVNMVRKGIGADTRIGSKFLYPGCGYGGSCFPKDVKALVKTAENRGYEMRVLKAVEEVNENQKHIVCDALLGFPLVPVVFARRGHVGNFESRQFLPQILGVPVGREQLLHPHQIDLHLHLHARHRMRHRHRILPVGYARRQSGHLARRAAHGFDGLAQRLPRRTALQLRRQRYRARL